MGHNNGPMVDLKNFIEHTLLKPEVTQDQLLTHCQEANQHQFLGVCLNPCWLPIAKSVLDTHIKLVTVVGFPLGANSSYSKAFEAEQAIKDGADEIDMVLNIGLFKSGEDAKVVQDITEVLKACQTHTLKVIVETGLLNEDEKAKVTKLVLDSGAAFIKTCTGFAPGSATPEDISLMKKLIGTNSMQIKASGGIRTRAQAHALIDAGATRLGTSQGVALVTGTQTTSQGY